MKGLIKKEGQIFIIIGLLILSVCIFSISYEFHYRGRFFPGITIGGEAVGGKAYGDVMASLRVRADALSNKGLDLVFESSKSQKEVRVPAFITGLTADNLVPYFSVGNWRGIVRQAYDTGRSGSLWQRIIGQFSSLLLKKHFNLAVTANDTAMQSLISRELKNFFKDSVSAQFTWDGLEMVITSGQPGEKVGIEEITSAINKRLMSFDTAAIYLKAKVDQPLVTAEQLQPFLKLANDIAISTRIIFYYHSRTWQINGTKLASWLTPKQEGGIGIDQTKLEAFLSKNVAPLIDDPPQDSRFEVRDGRLMEIVPGKPGNVVDIQKTSELVEQIVYKVQKSYALTGSLLLALSDATTQDAIQVQHGNVKIPIEIRQEAPRITRATIDEYGIRDLIGTAKTSFKGSSADRKHNIEVGVANLSGVLLAPGQEFSAVKGIGPTTEEAGFVKEFVIKDNKSVKELGGGLCQVATTLFRLALNTGLPVTERVNHLYVVSYYGPGLDATIYGPEPDLKFVNDTGNYILLQGRVEKSDLIFELYGQKDGRIVTISDPVLTDEIPAPDIKYVLSPDLPIGQIKCSETPHKGVTADVKYDVKYANGGTKEQNFHSVYRPWQRICLVGTGKL